MSPVPFSDINRPIDDLLNKDYPVNVFKLESKATAQNGVTFTLNGSQDLAKGILQGELKTKYSDKLNGITFTESWSSGNLITTQLEVADQVAKGLRLDLTASVVPNVGQRNAKALIEYKQPTALGRIGVDLFKGPTFTSGIVIGSRDGFLLGGEVGYDLLDGRVNKYNFAVGYKAADYTVTLHAMDTLSTYTAAYHHVVNSSVEAAAKATFDSKANSNGVNFEFGSKYFLDKTAFIKAKINNNGRLGLGYTQQLRPGVKLTLAGSLDTTHIDQATQKIGLALAFDN